MSAPVETLNEFICVDCHVKFWARGFLMVRCRSCRTEKNAEWGVEPQDEITARYGEAGP